MRQAYRLATRRPGWRCSDLARPRPAGLAVGELLEELLDAHVDTIELAFEMDELAWRAHLDYLQALQRLGRATLANLS
jgi:hypothetical protein